MKNDGFKLIAMTALAMMLGGVLLLIASRGISLALMFAAIALGGILFRMVWAKMKPASPAVAAFESIEPVELRVWLHDATRGLGALSRLRIAEEVAAHYDEALESARADGAPDAEAAAVASLGNPDAARRGFRRVYFSAREEKWIRGFGACNPNTLVRLLPALFLILGSIQMLALGFTAFVVEDPVAPALVMIGGMFVTMGICETVKRHWARRGRLRRAKWVDVFFSAFVTLGLLPLIFATSIRQNWWLTYAAILLPLLFVLYIEARAATKLPAQATKDFRRDFHCGDE